MADKKERIRAFLEKHSKNEKHCVMCPRACGVDRHIDTGDCGEPFLPRIASANLHHGEEPPISGSRGSGTIFFAGCNMHCAFCQNFPISQLHQANRQVNFEGLAEILLKLQARGAHNINLVTPSHYVYQFVKALDLALDMGFHLPIVYNSSGYDSLPIIKSLDGIVDVYLPDAKYADNETVKRFSGTSNYVENDRKALKEMFRQKSVSLETDDEGIAVNGMIIRHLVLPGQVENSKKVLKWIADELSSDIHLSLMSQYFPAHRVTDSSEFSDTNRRLRESEYDEVMDYAEELGLENGWFQSV